MRYRLTSYTAGNDGTAGWFYKDEARLGRTTPLEAIQQYYHYNKQLKPTTALALTRQNEMHPLGEEHFILSR